MSSNLKPLPNLNPAGQPPSQIPIQNFAFLKNGNSQQTASHALQDYQMQLMLLEQQNKKRLLMARQEADKERAGQEQLGLLQQQNKTRICCMSWNPNGGEAVCTTRTIPNPGQRIKGDGSKL